MNEDKCREELKPFKREVRYVVVKINDIKAAGCTQEEIDAFNVVCDKAAISRLADGKPSLECVVVEHDWPEYEIVWKMIQDRMEGNLRQESKALPVDEIATMLINHPFDIHDWPNSCYNAAKSIHSALPSQEDIEQLKLDRDQWNQAYRMEHLITEKLRSDNLAHKSGAKADSRHIAEQDEKIVKLQSELARKDEQIKELESYTCEPCQHEQINKLKIRNHALLKRMSKLTDDAATLRERVRELDDNENALVIEIDKKDEQIKHLEHEINVLRRFGNKDCTAMADDSEAKYSKESPTQHASKMASGS